MRTINHFYSLTGVLTLLALGAFWSSNANAQGGLNAHLHLDYILNPADYGIDPLEFGGALCVDGNRIAVHQWTQYGLVHVFQGSAETGFTKLWTINSPDPTYDSATFGACLGFRGNYLYSGSSHTWRVAPHDGTAYLFDLTTGALKDEWTESPHTAGYFGRIGGIAQDVLFVCQGSNPQWGSISGVFVYSLAGDGTRNSIWSFIQPTSSPQTQPVIATRDHLFARFTLVDGINPGIAVFDVLRDSNGNITGVATNTMLADTNLYGEATTGMDFSGGTLACANTFFASNTGAVFIYGMSSNGLTPLTSIQAPSGVSNVQFGADVRFVAGKLVVGAPGYNSSGTNRGCIFTYGFNADGSPVLLERYQPSTWVFGSQEIFGGVLAVSGNRLVVSSSGPDGSGAQGALYFLSFTNSAQLKIKKAVYVNSENLEVGTNYVLQVSPDLNNWTNYGSGFTATNANWRSTNYWDVDDFNQLFFRLRIAP